MSTPAGSTGWLSSLYNMAAGIEDFVNRSVSAAPPAKKYTKKKADFGSKGNSANPSTSAGSPKAFAGQESRTLRWEDRKLIFMVREPFRSNWSGADVVAGEIQDQECLTMESHMPEDGVIFSDGMLEDFIQFNSGATVEIRLAEKSTRLLVSPA